VVKNKTFQQRKKSKYPVLDVPPFWNLGCKRVFVNNGYGYIQLQEKDFLKGPPQTVDGG
jgi:hypothetical protein